MRVNHIVTTTTAKPETKVASMAPVGGMRRDRLDQEGMAMAIFLGTLFGMVGLATLSILARRVLRPRIDMPVIEGEVADAVTGSHELPHRRHRA